MSKEKMKYNIDEFDNLEELAPGLSKIKKENPFRVPDGYFDKLPMIIQEKITKTKSVSIWEQFFLLLKQPKYSVSLAVATMAIVIALFVFVKPDGQEYQFLSDITIEDILRENPELIYSMDETLIIEVLLAENGEDIQDYYDYNIKSDTSISDDEIIDYLSDENFDTELIYNL